MDLNKTTTWGLGEEIWTFLRRSTSTFFWAYKNTTQLCLGGSKRCSIDWEDKIHKIIQLKSVLQVKCDEMSNESPNPRCFFFSDVFPRSDRRRSSYSPDGWMKLKTNPIWTRHHHRTPWFLRKDDAITEKDVTYGRDHMYGIARPYCMNLCFFEHGWMDWLNGHELILTNTSGTGILTYYDIVWIINTADLLPMTKGFQHHFWSHEFHQWFYDRWSINVNIFPGTWNITKHHHGNPRVSGPCFAGWSMEPYNPVSWWMRRVSQGSLNGKGNKLDLRCCGSFFQEFPLVKYREFFEEQLKWRYWHEHIKRILYIYKFVHASRN